MPGSWYCPCNCDRRKRSSRTYSRVSQCRNIILIIFLFFQLFICLSQRDKSQHNPDIVASDPNTEADVSCLLWSLTTQHLSFSLQLCWYSKCWHWSFFKQNSTKFLSFPQNSCGQPVSFCTFGLSDISPLSPIFPEQMVSYGTSCLEEEAFQIKVCMNSVSSSAKCAFVMPVDKFSACLFDYFSWGLQENGLETEHLQRSPCWQKKALQWDVKYVHFNLYRQLASGKLDLWPVEDRSISKETAEALTGTRWDKDGGTNYIFTAVTPVLEVCWWQMTCGGLHSS